MHSDHYVPVERVVVLSNEEVSFINVLLKLFGTMIGVSQHH